MKRVHTLSYLITVSRAHFLPAQMLIITLNQKTDSEIVVVGNLHSNEVLAIEALGCKYIDENEIDYSGRLPNIEWEEKYRSFGWYKQMFIRLCIDRFMHTDQVVILDSEVFVFDNWDESRFYEPDTGKPKMFYWIPEKRKPAWDYRMYKGAAYLLSFLPEFKGVMKYANSNGFKRHISGVVLFSTKNVAYLWDVLEKKTNIRENIDTLFNHSPDLAFCDHDIYGIAVDYGLFSKVEDTVLSNELLGWYDNHEDKDFLRFQKNAMWSMCQNYVSYPDPKSYYNYMNKTAKRLRRKLPAIKKYWNKSDPVLVNGYQQLFYREKVLKKFLGKKVITKVKRLLKK